MVNQLNIATGQEVQPGLIVDYPPVLCKLYPHIDVPPVPDPEEDPVDPGCEE